MVIRKDMGEELEEGEIQSEVDMPEGVSEGTPVSYVADYAQHILNIKELQKKGYYASGDNDEEFGFSDDEKEAEYRTTKNRGMMNDQENVNTRNKKKKKTQDLERPTTINDSGEWTENRGGSSSLSSNPSDPQMGGPVSNHHQPQPQINGGGWMPQSNHQNSYQLPPVPNQMVMPNVPPMQIPLMAVLNQMMFRPQFNGSHLSIPCGLNSFQGQATAPWPALVGQNCPNQQPFGMGRGIQPPQLLNELILNLLASQCLQMHRSQSPMNPQCQMQTQFPLNPQFQMLNNNRPQFPMNPQFQVLNNNRPQSPMNPQFQMQPQFSMNPQFQMPNNNRPQSPVNPQFQMQPKFPMNPQFQMLNNNGRQYPMNPRWQMQPQYETRSQSQVTQSPTYLQSSVQPQFQGFNPGKSSEQGRGHRGRGGFGRGRGHGRARQQSG